MISKKIYWTEACNNLLHDKMNIDLKLNLQLQYKFVSDVLKQSLAELKLL